MKYNLTQKKRQGWPTQGAAMAVESDSYQTYPNGTVATRTRVSPVYSKT